MQLMGERPRATRYAMSAPILYRPLGAHGWEEGRTVNVSRSGVLFESPASGLSADTRLEFILVLPSLGLPGHSRVRCTGQIVRHDLAPAGGRSMAATIDAYDFLGIAAAAAPESTSG